jgi:hypothetical protein
MVTVNGVSAEVLVLELTRPGFVRAAPTRTDTSRLGLPSAPIGPLRRPDGKGLSPPLKSQRLTAHEAGAERVCDDLQRPDHPDRQLTNAKVGSTVNPNVRLNGSAGSLRR